MVRGWSRKPELLSFSYGRKSDRGRKARWEGPRGRSKSRIRSVQIPLVSFPPLNSSLSEGQVGEDRALAGWNSLFKDPKKVSLERVLSFFQPLHHEKDEDPFVLASEEAINREVKKWEKCLVGYVVGKRPHFQALKDRLETQWKTNGDFRMYSLPGGFFLFSFLNEVDRERILLEGPWSFYGRPLVIKEWVNGIEMEKEQFNALPIWIRLPNLKLSLWDLETLGKIASVVGHPRFIDEATANRDRLDYARICVEISPSCEFPSKVKILEGTKWTDQAIHYEWRPFCCVHCNSFEHAGDNCSLFRENEAEISSQAVALHPGKNGEGWMKTKGRNLAGSRNISGAQGTSNQPESARREKSKSKFENGGSSNAFATLQQEEVSGENEGERGVPNRKASDGDMADLVNILARDGNFTGSDFDSSHESDSGEGDQVDSEVQLTRVCETPTNSNLNGDLVDGHETRVCETPTSNLGGLEPATDADPTTRAGNAQVENASPLYYEGASPPMLKNAQDTIPQMMNAKGVNPLLLNDLDGRTAVSPNRTEKMQDILLEKERGYNSDLVVQLGSNENQGVGVGETRVPSNSENFGSHRGVRRSPRIKKVASSLVDMINPKSYEPLSSGKKKNESLGHQ